MAQVLRYLPAPKDANLLVGASTLDDAAVYRVSDDLAIVQTIDFITPVVDDAYSFGAIAAANALSDIYAMGAKPILALNIVGFPARTLPLSMLGEILRGGADKAAEAGVTIVGGHSIDDNEPKYGLAVTGFVHPDKLVSNSTAQPGDALILTKPLGIGIITTGIDRVMVDQRTADHVIEVMSELNRAAANAMVKVGVNACTDITGFGLLGHLHELAQASGVDVEVVLEKVPVLPEAWELVERGVVPDGTLNNHRYLGDYVNWKELRREEQLILCDAQTSGGLLIAVSQEKKVALLEDLTSSGVNAAEIGRTVKGRGGNIRASRQ